MALLPESIQDFIRSQGSSKSASAETLRHCKRELFHAVWAQLVQDPDFLEVYRHGIVIECADGITCHVYPRIFTYSTDYPERVLVATIRDLGHCPCPLCLVTIDQIALLGQVADERTRLSTKRVDTAERMSSVISARKIIYEKGYAPGNEHSDYFLKPESLVATENAFSTALCEEFGFNFFGILVVDLMHKFELGVWKAVLVHLIWMLYTLGKDAVNEFNHQFRTIGNFGRSTLRSFAYMNVTDLKNWAARTYEDCLQCCIPCFEGLFPEPYNTYVLCMLYTLALWHGLAKLRQHTDTTLNQLSTVTRMLGKELQFFASEVCPHFNTTETPKEHSARDQRETAKAMKPNSGTRGKGKAKTASPLPKTFSLCTVKIHLLGHYVPTIRWFGTTDSYSTQIGELEHRVVKSYYRRGNKKDYVRLATCMQRRSQQLYHITNTVHQLGVKAGHKSHSVNRSKSTPLPPFSPEHHHQIANSKKNWVHIRDLVSTNPSEPAFQNLIPALKDHILGRLIKRPFDGGEGDFSDEDRNHVVIVNNLLYQHSKMRINYTTYNIQRDQDIINPSIPSRSFVMVKAPETEKTCFWYAQVLGIYHVQVIHQPLGTRSPQTLEVLWIRWLGEDLEYSGGLASRQLERVGYVPEGDGAFGFLDPAVVIRGAHLIPSFFFEKTTDLLQESRFVDRDMLSCFLGTGAGHVALGLRSEPDIAVADTTAEPVPIPNDAAVAGPDEADLGNEYNSEEGSSVSSDSEDGEDEDRQEGAEAEAFFAADIPNGDDAWEDDDNAGFEDEDPIFDYDYSN
ncbi:hypothetical protein FRC05_011501 [Tulasnella sp. 425]|nr:hypothetical protein FRC05_011501 [Tulasnella sp. 425]